MCLFSSRDLLTGATIARGYVATVSTLAPVSSAKPPIAVARRTVILIRKETKAGQNLFLRGGISKPGRLCKLDL